MRKFFFFFTLKYFIKRKSEEWREESKKRKDPPGISRHHQDQVPGIFLPCRNFLFLWCNEIIEDIKKWIFILLATSPRTTQEVCFFRNCFNLNNLLQDSFFHKLKERKKQREEKLFHFLSGTRRKACGKSGKNYFTLT